MGDYQNQQSQALAAAIQRAKQIAAKIQPHQQGQQGMPGGNGSIGGSAIKRHNEDDLGPDNKRFANTAESDYGQNNSGMSGSGNNGPMSGAGQPNSLVQAVAQAAAVAARIAASNTTATEEQVRIPECILNAFMGRNHSDTITHIQSESNCTVKLVPDREGVISLRGARDAVTKAREMLQNMANRSGGGNVEVLLTINYPSVNHNGPTYQEIMIPGGKVGLVIGKGGDTIKQLQEKTGAKMVIIQDGPNQEAIKPLRITGEPQKIEHAKQLVIELISQKDSMPTQQMSRGSNMGGGGNGGAPGGGYNNFSNSGDQIEIFVPKVAVGVVIGKGGDMIRKIQSDCGCKLQFIQGKNDEPGDRRCLIQGNPQQVEEAKSTIEGLIETVMQRNNRNGNGNGGGDSNYGYGYGVNHMGREEITFMVPASKCGIVIGRGGETIKLINQQTGAYTEMDRNATNQQNEKLFKCKGTAEQVEAARQMIIDKIQMDLPIISRKPISGGGSHQAGGGHHQNSGGGYNQMQGGDPNAAAYQQQWANYGQQGGWDAAQQQQMVMGQNAASGQQDYSAQWIEYYKSLGMHREAEAIEQQLKSKQATGGAVQPQMQTQMPQQQQPQQQQQQQTQQPDYSAQWAEYYRSIGKVEEAEAIEKQMKSKQQNSGAMASSATANAPSPGHQNMSNPAAAAQAPAAAANPYQQNMTASQYAQYSQYYAAAAAAGQPQVAGGYPPQAYPGYGAYPGAPQPSMGGGPGQQSKPHKTD